MSEGKIARSLTLRVEVDPDLCCAYGLCAEAAPQLFALGDDDISTVLIEDISEDDAPLVETAVRECPTQALSIVSASP